MQNGRVVRVVVLLDAGVVAVGRQRVLNQVIGADADIVHFPHQVFDDLHRSRDFDHDSERDVTAHIVPLAQQFVSDQGHDLPDLADLVQAADQGKHHGRVAGLGSQ